MSQDSYLKHCSQCVRIGASNLTLCKVLSDVPQASVLGPLLFVIFIDDLPHCTHSAPPFILADDTKLLAIKSTSDSDKLQHDINDISIWSQASYTFPLTNLNLFTYVFGKKVHLTHLVIQSMVT